MQVVGVKFNNNSKLYYFLPNKFKLNENDAVVVETVNGEELGYIKKVAFELEENFEEPLKKVLRMATQKDIDAKNKLDEKYPEVLKTTQDLIKKFNLDMKIVSIDFTLDGKKILITYVCEDRVDFRDLVKELASKLKSRIELKQIGIRDQAKIVGGIGICGQPCCCNRFLNEFGKVSIKMAKNQNLSLNPSKISGVCGRLMCCLSYENDLYAESLPLMPKINSVVETPTGKGIVIYNDLLNKKCTVKFEGDEVRVNTYDIDDIKFERKVVHNEIAGNNKNETKESNKITDNNKKDKTTLKDHKGKK